MPDRSLRLLINGLSVGSGGGYTVAVQLWRHLALARPEWTVTLALSAGRKLHESAKAEAVPANCRFHWATPDSVGLRGRNRYERTTLAAYARRDADAVLQLNGMIVPGLELPTLVHHQDPFPYRPEAWTGPKDRVFGFLKRRAHARGLREADCVGWTSAYLRDLVCGRLGITPACSEVLHNGLPDDWIERAGRVGFDFDRRAMRLVSVSNVSPYKRQDLVIRAMPLLLKTPGLETLTYHVAGHGESGIVASLEDLARSLGVADHVVFEGRVSDERVVELVGTSRAFVLMSVCESFGIPAIEAMSLGTPVVTSDCCAMPEVCGSAADLCPTDDLPALVGLLTRVLTDKAHAEDLSRRGAGRVGQFAWTHTAGRMADLIERITARRTAA